MRRLNRGITIVEVVMVTVIVAVVASMILPSFRAMERSQAALGFRQGLETVAQKARLQAIQQNRATQLQFDANGNIGWDFAEDAATDPVTGESLGNEELLELGQVRDSINPTATTSFVTFELNNENSSQTDWKVGFYPDGTADQASLEFTMDEQTFLFRVNHRTGTARVIQETASEQAEDEWPAGEIERRVG